MKCKRLNNNAERTWSSFRMAEAESNRRAAMSANKEALWNTNWKEKSKKLPMIPAIKAIRIATGWRLRRCLATARYIKREILNIPITN